MSFNYSGSPATSLRDQVRFLLQDTTTPGHHLEDEEIDWITSGESDPWFAAASLADTLSTRYGSYPTSKTIGETSVTYGDLTMKFQGLASRLRNSRRQTAVAPYAGGISRADKLTREQNTDREEFVAKKTTVPEPGIHD